jgi:ligand-binding sensor domain-containing protein
MSHRPLSMADHVRLREKRKRSATGEMRHTELLGLVRSLCAGRDGSLWIGTAAGLVGHIRGEDLTTFSVGAQAEAMVEDRTATHNLNRVPSTGWWGSV